jgi:DNA (cytosine-5)-methyltransferase 1
MPRMKMIDLFSGIGGFSLAARWCDIETIQFVENNDFCIRVLEKNFPNIPIHRDIKDFNFYDSVDILTGGFPCQPFSVAGKKKGEKDDRYLWPEMFRIIKQCKPKFIIAENVPGIIPLLDPILKDLEREEYNWDAFLIPASALGAPHKRERLWIIAYDNSKRCNDRIDNREKRQIQDNWKRNIETIQSEWLQFIHESWATFNAQDWLADTYSESSIKINKKPKPMSTKRKSWMGHTRPNRSNSIKFNWQENKPPISGVDDGLPNCVDRNKSLGNAIVPQMAYIFLKAISLSTKSDYQNNQT